MTDAEGLEATLDRVHRSILLADYGDLSKFLQEAERLILRIASSLTAEAARRIQAKANRNGQCLKAAARGMRAAQRRLDEVTAAGNQMSTYTNLGQRTDLGARPSSMAKRL